MKEWKILNNRCNDGFTLNVAEEYYWNEYKAEAKILTATIGDICYLIVICISWIFFGYRWGWA
jgi:hypothetical protein